MASIEEMLAQAESMTVEENWFRLEKYPEKSFYSDSDIGVDVVDRKISNADRNVSTTEEKNSQYISFIMDRYCDGVDLTTMLIQVKYELPDGSGSIDGVVNAYASESQIRFGWVVPSTITQDEGTILLMVFCSGSLSDGNSYLLKTQPLPYTINKTLDIEGTLPEPDENWYIQFINTMNERVTAASRYASEAREYATEADETLATVEDIQADVTQSKEEVQTLATQVQNNTSKAQNAATNAEASASSASKSAENAKKYSEQAFNTTPAGYEVLVGDVDLLKNAIVQTTDRTLYGSKAGGIKLIGIKGASEQKQYSGKNLLDLSTLTETTSNGVTFTPIFENSMLQYILVNGTATAQARYYFPSGLTFETDTILSLQGATNGGVSGYASGMNVFAEEKTITANTSYGTFFLFVNEGSTVNNVKIYPMVSVEGGDYEPFVGGTASPNPIYPQEIESVGDIKNLLEVTATSQTVSGITFTVNEDKTIAVIGTATEKIDCIVSTSIYGNPVGESMILSGCPSGGSNSTYKMQMWHLNNGGVAYDYGSGAEFTLTDEMVSDTYNIAISIQSGTVMNHTFKPMIRKASVKNAEYKPHGYSLGIKADGKNLYNPFTDIKGIISQSGEFSTSEYYLTTDYIKVNGVMAFSGIITSDVWLRISLYDENKNFIKRADQPIYEREIILSFADVDARYIRVSFENYYAKYITDFQIEYSNVITDYEPYRSKSITIPLSEPLRKGDEIAVVDGAWGIDRNTESLELNGSESWSLWSLNKENCERFYVTVVNSCANISKTLCTHFVFSDSDEDVAHLKWSNGTDGINQIVLFIPKSVASTVDELRTWLAENPVTVVYELATPTFEPFTDQTPFYGLESFDTVTYISTDSEVEPSIELKFAKTEGDAVTLLNYNQTNLNRIAIEEFIKSNTSQEEVTE